MTTPLLSLENLSIHFGKRRVVDRLFLNVYAGERVALVGESGSGKTVTALSILRLAAQARIEGHIRLEGRDLTALSEDEIRDIRGGEVAMVFQEPMSALNPLFTIGEQIIETLVRHEAISREEARHRTVRLLARTGLRDPERRVDSYPHQLSGGQLQRAVIAMALACRPKLLIADEPTTALDTTIRARIVRLLLDLQAEEAARGAPFAILLITHDLNLVRRFAQRVAVMEKGRLVESAETETLFSAPEHPYTRRLIDSAPRRTIDPVAEDAEELLRTQGLRVEYPKPLPGWRGLFRSDAFVALAGADIRLRAGETIGVVGESGSGKSTLAQTVLGLTPARSGELRFEGKPLRGLDRPARKQLRARLQVVFQDPFGSLSPRRTVFEIIAEGLDLHFPELTEQQVHERVGEVLRDVGLPVSAQHRYPHQFSGGQRQRIAIARAIVLRPRVVILDEPTSALDVSIQNQVLELLVSLQRKYRIAYLLITHDLAVVNALAHRLYVLKDGEIVEEGDTETVIRAPKHEYTQRLVSAGLS